MAFKLWQFAALAGLVAGALFALLSPAVGAVFAVFVPATILAAEMRESGFGRTRVKTPMVALKLADGRIVEDELDGSAGRVFAEGVSSGASGRAQFYRGKLVRVTSGDSTAETLAAPDVAATTDVQMIWSGAVMTLAGALVAVYAALRMRQRVR